jgi:hypothetical protein
MSGILITVKLPKLPVDFAYPVDIVFDSDTHFIFSLMIDMYLDSMDFNDFQYHLLPNTGKEFQK